MRSGRPRGRDRLLLFTTGLQEPGGMAKHGRLLAAGFEQRGWEVKAICRMSSGIRPKTWTRRGLYVVEVPGFDVPWIGRMAYIVVALLLGSIWSRSARGIIGLQLTAPSVAATTVSLVSRRPVLVLSTSSGPGGDIEHALSARGFRRRLLSKSTCFVAQTRAAEREILSCTEGAATAVVPTPVVRGRPRPLMGNRRALFAGRLVPEKNLATLLKSWRLVLDDVAGAELIVAGVGPPEHERSLKQLAEPDERMRASVDFAGWVDDIERQLDTADVFVLPSLIEGMSNSLLEACSAGRVVVASDIPPNVEVLGEEYPLLCSPTDVRSLADNLVLALTNDTVRRRCLAQIQDRVKRFDVESVVGELEELLCGTPDLPRDQYA